MQRCHAELVRRRRYWQDWQTDSCTPREYRFTPTEGPVLDCLLHHFYREGMAEPATTAGESFQAVHDLPGRDTAGITGLHHTSRP